MISLCTGHRKDFAVEIFVSFFGFSLEFEIFCGNAEEDIKVLTRKITNAVEKYVRKYPEQWLWIHKRWNTRPKGEKNIY
jgi:KDO2-lipid IV(A) lauroyltransferase